MKSSNFCFVFLFYERHARLWHQICVKKSYSNSSASTIDYWFRNDQNMNATCCKYSSGVVQYFLFFFFWRAGDMIKNAKIRRYHQSTSQLCEWFFLSKKLLNLLQPEFVQSKSLCNKTESDELVLHQHAPHRCRYTRQVVYRTVFYRVS